MGSLPREPANEQPVGRPEYRLPVTPALAPKRTPKHWPWVVGALTLVTALGGYVAYWSLVPHIGRASHEEILMAIPSDLRTMETPDPAAEERFVRLSRLLHETFEKEDAEQEARLDPSAVLTRRPEPTPTALADYERRCAALMPKVQALFAEGELRATKAAGERGLRNWTRAMLSREGVLAAARRGDRKTCLQDALWRIRLTDWVERAGLSVDSYPSLLASDRAQNVETIYQVELAGGYDRAGRERILAALVPPDADRLLSEKVQRYFRDVLVPQVTEIAAGGDYWKVRGLNEPPELRAGTFDPIETIELMVAGVRACRADLYAPPSDRMRVASFARDTLRPLEDLPPKTSGIFSSDDYQRNLEWRMAMNRCRNSLGAEWAVSVVPSSVPLFNAAYNEGSTLDNKARFNLVRAVLTLRQGRTAMPADPFGAGPLHFDRKRRLVWSLGPNRVDDGGKTDGRTGRMPSEESKDIVYPY